MVDFDVVDAGAGWPVPHMPLESFERVSVAFRGDFDTAVGKISDPPVQTLAHRRRFGKEPKADALDTSADQIPTRDAHAEEAGRAIILP